MASPIAERQRGRPATITREMILEAAADLAMAKFSVRAIADELGVSPQSIYHYFPSKNALLGAIAEESVTNMPTVDTHDWRSYFRTSLLGYRSWLLSSASPALEPEINGSWARLNDEPSEGILNLMESFVSFFVAAGFTSHQAIEVWNLGTTLVVRSLISRLGDAEIADHFRALQEDVGSLGAENFPTLSDALSQAPPPAQEMFERIVEVAIEGVAAVYKVA
ncbi:MAG TPA: TetR/AcrR family transcriptional regulator [Myxococcales bacterium]|nr:TetR/AcrR family transcriptional regulator [Myxococcales bacterium]HIM00273.1 TetR/AcrR family transcriptional regulator [Myxococcales bacterium]